MRVSDFCDFGQPGGGLCQSNHSGIGQMCLDDETSQIAPPASSVEYLAIGAGYHRISFDEFLVGIGADVDRPWPVMIGGSLRNPLPQPAAVGHGLVEIPHSLPYASHFQSLADEQECFGGLGDSVVGTMDAGKVAKTGVDSFEDQPTRQRHFDGDEQIESVDRNGLAA